jgi:hypothetical protein
MGKRSNFERIENDAYFTPFSAVPPLIPHLEKCVKFLEPCAGAGDLINHLEKFGHICEAACDLEPQAKGIVKANALEYDFRTFPTFQEIDYIITNPPWERELLNPMIERFMEFAPTWLLFDADWPYTIQKEAAKKTGCKLVPELLKHCKKIVPIGRVKWIPNSKSQGKENCAWYLFDKNHTTYPIFYPKSLL